jgi:hypothetical protein
MKAVAGSILILAAAVVVAAQWLGKVQQNPNVVGSPEAGYLTLTIGVLALAGVAVLIAGLVTDRKA